MTRTFRPRRMRPPSATDPADLDLSWENAWIDLGGEG
jgi:hypothetical protein